MNVLTDCIHMFIVPQSKTSFPKNICPNILHGVSTPWLACSVCRARGPQASSAICSCPRAKPFKAKTGPVFGCFQPDPSLPPPAQVIALTKTQVVIILHVLLCNYLLVFEATWTRWNSGLLRFMVRISVYNILTYIRTRCENYNN